MRSREASKRSLVDPLSAGSSRRDFPLPKESLATQNNRGGSIEFVVPAEWELDAAGELELGRIDDEDSSQTLYHLKRWILTSSAGRSLHFLGVLISLLSCVLYTAETYYLQGSSRTPWMVVEIVFAVLFTALLAIDAVLSRKPMEFMLSLQAMLDFVTILPVFAISMWGHLDSVGLRTFMFLRALRVTKLEGLGKYVHSEISKQVFVIFSTVLSIAFISASALEVVESHLPWLDDEAIRRGFHPLQMHNAFYLISITLTTVGYGDVVPATSIGRTIVLVTLVFVFLQVPRETNRLVALLSKQSVYVRQSYAQSSSVPHVIVCGTVGGWGNAGLRAFLEELFNDDHGDEERHAVVLAPGSPSAELQVLMQSPRFRNGVTYLDGNVMSHTDLHRACAHHAAGIFLMCNKYADAPDAEDSSTILRALAVKRFVYQRVRTDIFVCAQLIRAENRVLFHSSMASISHMARQNSSRHIEQADQLGGTASRTVSRHMYPQSSDPRTTTVPTLDAQAIRTQTDEAFPTNQKTDEQTRQLLQLESERSSSSLSISVQELKLNLLAKSCLCPGIIPMLFNLIASDDGTFDAGVFEAVDEEDGGDSESSDDGGAMGIPPAGYGVKTSWVHEYRSGGEYEIYRVPLSSVFGGCTFSAAARIIYEETDGVVLFAIDLLDSSMVQPVVAVCPTNLVIPTSQSVLVHAYCLARDKREADIASSIAPVEAVQTAASSKQRRRASISGLFTPSPSNGLGRATSTFPTAASGATTGPPAGDAADMHNGSSTRLSRASSLTNLNSGGTDNQFRDALRSWVLGTSPKGTHRGSKRRHSGGQPVILKLHHKLRLAKSQVKHKRHVPRPCAARLSRSKTPFGGSGNAVGSKSQPEGPSPREHSSKASASKIKNGGTASQKGLENHTGISAGADESADHFHRRVSRAARQRKRNLKKLLESSIGNAVRPLETAIIPNVGSIRGKKSCIQNHILIVCSREVQNLYHLVKPLRAHHLVDHLPIVVLSPVPVHPHTWGPASRFHDVYIIRGSPMAKHDLIRAGVHDALAVVLLASSSAMNAGSSDQGAALPSARTGGGAGGSSQPQGASSGIGGYLVDSDVICAYRLIRDLVPNCEAIVEISQQDSIQFLSTTGLESPISTLLSPPFVAGHCFTPSFLDIIMSQAFYNRHVVSIVNNLVTGGDDRVLRSWTSNQIEQLSTSRNAKMYLIPVPGTWIGKKYGSVWRQLLAQREMLAFGLRRRCPDRASTEVAPPVSARQGSSFLLADSSEDEWSPGSSDSDEAGPSSRQSPFRPPPVPHMMHQRSTTAEFGIAQARAADPVTSAPYVFCNPSKSTVLNEGDMLYVLSPKPPRESYGSWRSGPTSDPACAKPSRDYVAASSRSNRVFGPTTSSDLPEFASIEDMLRGRGKTIQVESAALPPTTFNASSSRPKMKPIIRANTGIPSMSRTSLSLEREGSNSQPVSDDNADNVSMTKPLLPHLDLSTTPTGNFVGRPSQDHQSSLPGQVGECDSGHESGSNDNFSPITDS